jgi:hypothetical protein
MTPGNAESMVRMFRAMAERVEAGEPWRDVLADYGLRIEGATEERLREAVEELVQTIIALKAENRQRQEHENELIDTNNELSREIASLLSERRNRKGP